MLLTIAAAAMLLPQGAEQIPPTPTAAQPAEVAETPIAGLPISEKIATFAADNEMSFCKPPIDLSI